MALTITAQPPERCYVGTPTKDGNVVPFDFTSNLSPLNTVATPRTILAKGTTDSGFFYIEVNASHAAEFPTGGYVQGVQAGLRDVLYIVQGITGTNHRIVLAVQDAGWVVSSSTAVPAFNNFAVEIQLLSPGRDDRYILTSEKNDLQGYYRRVMKENLLAAEGVDVELLAREIYTGSATSFVSVQESTAFWGRLDADQTDTGRLLSGRPRVSRVYDGQRVPFAFIGDGSGDIVADFGDYDTFTPIVDDEMNLYVHEVFDAGSPKNVITLGGIGAYTLQIVKPRLEYVELAFRNKDGQWDSTFVFFNGQRQSEDKDEQYISTYREAASSYGAQITNKGRQFFQNNTSRVWQMTTGVVGDNEVQWLVDLLASDSVFYRNGEDYWPVRILPTATNWDDLTTSHPSISFEMVSAFGLTLQRPEPVTPVDPLDTIWDEYAARAIADSGIAPSNLACLLARFKSWYKRAYNDYVKEQGLRLLAITTPAYFKAGKVYSQIGSDWTVARASTATRVNSLGLIESVANNVPRFDFLNGACPALLREAQATNGILNSENVLTNWLIGTNLTRTFVNVKGLDGQELEVTTAGSSLSFSAGRTQRGISFSLNSGSTYTISLIVKRTSTHSIFGYYLLATNNLGAGFNVDTLTTGQLYENAVFGSRVRRITPLGNDEFLCEETFTMTDNRTATVLYVAPVVGTTNPANPSVGSRMGFAAPQIELGSKATSRILTGASTVTRIADVITKTEEEAGSGIVVEFENGSNTAESSTGGTFTLPVGRIINIVEVNE
jgi:hypothetical protein